MASPVTFAQVDAAVVLPEDDLGVAIVKAHVIFPQIATAVMEYMFNADGTLTAEFIADIAAIDCSAFES